MFCGPVDHALNYVSVPLVRYVAVDRGLPGRVPLIKFVCSAAERIFNDYYLHPRNLGRGSAHATSLCQMPRIVRMSVAKICAMPISAV